MCGFCNVWACVCVGFAMCGCVVCMCWFCNVKVCGFCNVWVCVCVGFVMCGRLYVWDLQCVGVWCVCVGFVMCGCVFVWVL